MLKGLSFTLLITGIVASVLIRTGVVDFDVNAALLDYLQDNTPLSSARLDPTPAPAGGDNSGEGSLQSTEGDGDSGSFSLQDIFRGLEAGALSGGQNPAPPEDEVEGTRTPHSQPEAGPTPSPTPTGAPEGEASGPEYGTEEWAIALENMVHLATNEERQERGIAPLSYDTSLAEIGQGHSQDMAANDFFSHEGSGGLSPSDRAEEAGYECARQYDGYSTTGFGENIFTGSSYAAVYYEGGEVVGRDHFSLEEMADRVVTEWMDSPGHRDNILQSHYRQEGIGVAIAPGGTVYVTQNLC